MRATTSALILLTALPVVFMLFVFTGCASDSLGPADGEGVVFEIHHQRILVLREVKQEDLGKTWNDLMDTYQGHAIWLSIDEPVPEIGQKIRYWVDGGIQESYPEQATAKAIERIQDFDN